MINLYLHTTSSPFANFEKKLAELPLVIQKHILRRKQKSKKEISLRGYLLLQHALQKDFGINLEVMTFLDSGKPVLKGQSIHFNISHSGNLVGVAISKIGALGLDIEQYRTFEKVESAFSFFSKVEQKAILNAEMPDRKLIDFWSKKEALVKAVGGQMFDMSAHTDIRFSSSTWLGLTYSLHAVQHEYDNFIWIASSFPCNNITTKQVKSL